MRIKILQVYETNIKKKKYIFMCVCVCNLQYTHNTPLLPSNEEEIEGRGVLNLEKTVKQVLRLRINIVKTKVMVVNWAEYLPVSIALGE